MTAWWAIFCARVDLPIPFGPTRIALVASLRNSSDIRASMAGLSHFFGHAQSKSHRGLKRPICASLRRRSKLRRARSCSSHSMRSWSHPAAVASCPWASRPWRPSALALACRASRLFIGRPLELVIEFEPRRSDRNVARLDMVGQIGSDGRQLLALMAPPLKGETDGAWVRHVAIERLDDGGLQLGRAVAIQEPQHGAGDGAEIAAALGGADQQGLAGGRRMREPVGAAVQAGGMFLLDQGLDMGGVLDLGALVITASMTDEDVLAVDNAHLVGIGEHGERAPHVGVGDGVIVQIEPDIGRLAGGDGHPLEQRVGVVRQLQQQGRFLGKGLANPEGVLSGAASIRRQAAAPGIGLSIEVVQIDKFAGRKEAVADVADRALHPAFLVASGGSYGTWFVTIMSGELEQGGMETDGVAVALHNNAFEIVVEDDPRDPGPCPKGLDMAAQEVLHAGIEEEAQEDVARITQHHDEGHQGAACTADREMAEVAPV